MFSRGITVSTWMQPALKVRRVPMVERLRPPAELAQDRETARAKPPSFVVATLLRPRGLYCCPRWPVWLDPNYRWKNNKGTVRAANESNACALRPDSGFGTLSLACARECRLLEQPPFFDSHQLKFPASGPGLEVLLPQGEDDTRTHREYGLFHREHVIFHRR